MSKFTGTINKLIKGLRYQKNRIFFLETQQFYSQERDRTITMFLLSERVWSEERQTYARVQVLKTASQIDIVQYLAEQMKNS